MSSHQATLEHQLGAWASGEAPSDGALETHITAVLEWLGSKRDRERSDLAHTYMCGLTQIPRDIAVRARTLFPLPLSPHTFTF